MARLIMKSPYFKPGSKHASNFTKYIATREGVDKTDDTWKLMSATYNQKRLITQILRDFPDSADTFEYEDYMKSNTRGNASEFIIRALEDNADKIAGRKTYVNYIATRPRVEKLGTHGLFTDSDVPVDLTKVTDEIDNHEGNIWSHIISLRREDAERLGFDNAARWKALLRSHAESIATGMKIPFENFRWYAAYHDEGHHPHLHVVAYSADPKEGYLSVKGIENIKSALANDVFSQDLISVYTGQTKHRDELTATSKTAAADIIRRINEGVYDNPKAERLLAGLYERLKNHKRKMQYGYLIKDVKAFVDAIVDELAADPRIAELYDLWYEKKFESLRTYRKEMPDKLPLSQQSDFKPIKNIVISEALNLRDGAFTFEDEMMQDDEPNAGPDAIQPESDEAPPPDEPDNIPEAFEYHAEWSDEYKEARAYLYGSEDVEQNFETAYELMTAEAGKGNAFALYDAGRMRMDGLGCEKDADTAQEWYANAYQAFTVAELQWEKNAYIQYRLGKMSAQGFGVEQSFTAAADWYEKAVVQKNPFAAYALGGLHYRGQGVINNYERAFELYTMAANDIKRPNFFAVYELAKMYRDGIGTEKDLGAADQHFIKAYNGFCKLEEGTKDDKLQYRLGQMNLTGTGTKVNLQNTCYYFEKSAKLENVNAMYGLGKLYLNNKFEGYDVKKAAKWLFEASERGHDYAQYTLGKLFLKGDLVRKEVAYGIKLLEQSAEQNNQWAQYVLGKEYLNGENVQTDPRKAEAYLSASSEQRNQWAQYKLAKMLLSGEYIPSDVPKAVELLNASAAQDNEHAQYTLGKLYLKGELVPKDIPQAVKLLKKASEKDNQYAQFLLGKLYIENKDIPKNVPAALSYFEQSAAQGNHYALYALGKLWLFGKDVERDEAKAVRYLTEAREQGNPFAAALLESIEKNRQHSLFMGTTRLLYHLSSIFKDKIDARSGGAFGMTDRKLRRIINEKKAAQGIRQ